MQILGEVPDPVQMLRLGFGRYIRTSGCTGKKVKKLQAVGDSARVYFFSPAQN